LNVIAQNIDRTQKNTPKDSQDFPQNNEDEEVVPQFTDSKLDKIATPADDRASENMLIDISKKAGWFPKIKIKVHHGIVVLDGEANNADQLKWLTETANKLPTVIAVVNKADLISPPLTDMSPFKKEWTHLADLLKKNLPRIIVGFVLGTFFIFIGFQLYKLFKSFFGKRIKNVFLAATVAKLISIPMWVILFYVTLLTIGLQNLATTIIGGTGVLSIVFGFAFKNIAENYLAGILLAMRSPFVKGDAVNIANVEGIVQNLNMRGTTILDWDGNLLLIPNSTVINSTVKNMSANSELRTSFLIRVSYSDSIKKCQDLINEALKSIEGIKKDPAPLIIVDQLGTSSIFLKIYFWFNQEHSSELNLKTSAMIKTKELFLANKITIPDEGREVVFSDTLQIKMSKESINTEEKQQKAKTQAEENFKEAHKVSEQKNSLIADLKKVGENCTLPQAEGENNLLKH
jgi:small-conductance mechanosensitive channel